MLPVISGVPQGSVLGPLLFLVFINEVTNQDSLVSFMSLFADDIALYRCIKSPVDYWKLQLDINTLVDWICQQYFSLLSPTCQMLLHVGIKEENLQPTSTHSLCVWNTIATC